MRPTPEQIEALVRLGAGVTLSARWLPPAEMTRLTGLAMESGARLTVLHAGAMTPAQREALAHHAGGRIHFDFTEE